MKQSHIEIDLGWNVHGWYSMWSFLTPTLWCSLFCSFTYVEAGSGFSYKNWFRRHKAIRVHFMSVIAFLFVVLMCKFGVRLSFNKPTSLFGCTFWSHFPEQEEAVCHCSTVHSGFVFCLWMKAHSSGIHLCSLWSQYKQFIMKGGRKLKTVHNIRSSVRIWNWPKFLLGPSFEFM